VLPQLDPNGAPQLESGSQWLRVLARPQHGISITQARPRLAVVWPQMASIAITPRMNAERRQGLLKSSIALVPGVTGFSRLREEFRRPLLILMSFTGLVLLISCANFANLLLARGAARSKEIAVRFAIGAGRWRIVRQLVTESVMLSLAGASLGIGLAALASRSLVALLSSGRRDVVFLELKPDAGVLLFTSAVALATGILFGLSPALGATASGPGAALKADSGITPRLQRSRPLIRSVTESKAR
jgi:putative ABC transport system permease protein